jgi:hypothetical protein
MLKDIGIITVVVTLAFVSFGEPAAVRAQIFVANHGNGTIGEYGLDGSTINAALITGLNGP